MIQIESTFADFGKSVIFAIGHGLSMVPIPGLQRFMAARVPSTLPAGAAFPGAATAMPGTNFMMEPVTMPPGAAMAPGAAYAAPTMGTMGSMPPMMGMMPPTYAAPPPQPCRPCRACRHP